MDVIRMKKPPLALHTIGLSSIDFVPVAVPDSEPMVWGNVMIDIHIPPHVAHILLLYHISSHKVYKVNVKDRSLVEVFCPEFAKLCEEWLKEV